MANEESVLILTPLKDAGAHLDHYFECLETLDYPWDRISLGFLESDSADNTFAQVGARLPALRNRGWRAEVWKRDFGYRLPPGVPRWDFEVQVQRRSVLARSRNYLLAKALCDEAWVLWLDVDVIEYPSDVLRRLLATGRDIVQPNCVKQYGGRSFDLNCWRDHGRLLLHQLKPEGDVVPVDSVGGTMLLVRADLHREGLVFPTFLYGCRSRLARRRHHFSTGRWWNRLRPGVDGEIETEGLAMMAHDMGYRCWGMPNLEIRHKDA